MCSAPARCSASGDDKARVKSTMLRQSSPRSATLPRDNLKIHPTGETIKIGAMLEAMPRVREGAALREGQRGRGVGWGQERTLSLDQPPLGDGRNNRYARQVGMGEGLRRASAGPTHVGECPR